MDIITRLLDVETTLNGRQVKVSSLSPELQTDYLISKHPDILRSDEAQEWRLQNLYFIMTKSGTKSLFKFNRAQQEFWNDYIKTGYKKLIILKSRQLGMTTFMSIYFLDSIIFNPNREALQIAHTLKDAGEIFNRKIVYAVKNLYPCIKSVLEFSQAKSSRQQFSYPDGSISAISVANSGRSGTFYYVHISELGKLAKLYQGRAEEIVTGTLPSIPVGGRAIIESTAESASGLFFEMFMGSWKKRDAITVALSKAEFKPCFYNWTYDDAEIKAAAEDGIISVSEMDECEINWKEYQEEHSLTDVQMNYYYLKWINSGKDVDKLHQEYPTTPMEAFLSSGSPFFSSRKVAEFIDKTTKDYTRFTYSNGQLYEDTYGDWYIYEEPKPGRHYVLSGDVAEGLLDGDYSTAFVLGTDKSIKAYYQGHIEPDEYSKMVQTVGKRYNTAMMAIEFNKDGNWVNTDIHISGYPNLYVRETIDSVTRETTKSYGWLTNKKTRDFMLGEAKKHFNSLTELNCLALLEEMLVFVRDKRGRPAAASGKHDDLVMAYAIGIAVLQGKKDTIDPIAARPNIANLLWPVS